MEGLFLFLIVMCIYFLPTILACCEGKKNRAAIFFLNLLLGWTFFGWVASLVWAVCKDPEYREDVIRKEIYKKWKMRKEQ